MPSEAICKTCQTPLQGSICHNCGQRQIDKRWSLSILGTQFLNQLTNIENGFTYTIKGLFLFPGKLITDYWEGRTVKYYNPFRYLIILTAINVILAYWLNIDDILEPFFESSINSQDMLAESREKADQAFDSRMNLLVILLVPVHAFMTWLLFHNSKKNYAEHIIMNSFIAGQHAIIGTLPIVVLYLVPGTVSFFPLAGLLLGAIYNSYLYIQTFNERWWLAILKALAVGIFGIIVFSMFIILSSNLAMAMAR